MGVKASPGRAPCRACQSRAAGAPGRLREQFFKGPTCSLASFLTRRGSECSAKVGSFQRWVLPEHALHLREELPRAVHTVSLRACGARAVALTPFMQDGMGASVVRLRSM